ncbi:hypothetical protein Anae109_4009 [Anaeromyxobacter sp. Fw109-5]|nr:hypothetical protein Anae109_4009 [Anaeromyxobacter sp. Fw109-5]
MFAKDDLPSDHGDVARSPCRGVLVGGKRRKAALRAHAVIVNGERTRGAERLEGRWVARASVPPV